MADISKIQTLDGTTYDIKDTTARNLIPTNISDLANDSGFITGMEILSYGNSTWNDFITAYNAKKVVYCRASSNANPASGSQTRLAFMAYVSNADNPTNVEFQYYRSVSSHTDAQQGDQVYIYKLTSAGTWTVTVRKAYTKIVAGTNMTSSYANGTLTLNATGGGGGTSDYDDLTDKPSINNVTLSGNKTAEDLGLGTYSKPSGGIPQTDFASAAQSKLDNTVVVSDTQPTATENKLWVDTDASTGSTYQVPTVAEMEAADNTILGNLAMIESSPATAAHAVGEYIVLNGQLYKVTAAIASGQTLTPGTNIAAVSGGGLNDLRVITTFGVTANTDALSSMDVRAYRCGNLAFLSFDAVLKNQISAWTDTTIATMTVTPIDRVYMSCFTNDGLGVNIQLYQNSNELKIRPLNRTIAAATGFRGTVMFFIN